MNENINSQSPANDKAAGDSKNESRPPMSARRLWLFHIIAAFVIPVLALLPLELALRVVGYGYPTSTFMKGVAKGRPVYLSNNRFGWRFFPPEISRELEPIAVPADKTNNTYRIFILGESAARGEPDTAYSFGRILRAMLRQKYPSVNFEVFTVAMAAINSHCIVPIAKDCRSLKPDLFVVYMGNNEVTGPYGAETVFAPLSKSLLLIRMGVAIRATRLGQLMTRLADAMSSRGEKLSTWQGLEMHLEKKIRHDDERIQFCYSHFRRNLEDIMRITRGSGAKIVVSTVAVNLKDCPPFGSLHRASLNEQQEKNFDGLYQRGIELEKTGDFNSACENYLAAAQIDDTYAELQFRLGRCQWNLGRFDEAKQSYSRALVFDALWFRADPSINQIIREASRNKTDQGIYLVDAADVFEQQSPHNCPGFEFFLEHVHFNFSGNYLLARTIFDKVEEILPDRIKTQKVKDAGLPSEARCAELLAFTDYDNYRLTQANFRAISEKKIYINQVYHDEAVDIWRQKVEQLKDGISRDALVRATKQYEQAIKLCDTDCSLRRNYAKLLCKDPNNAPAAIEQCRLIVEQTPQDHTALVTLAGLELNSRDVDAALKHAARAIEIMPTNTSGTYLVGSLYQAKNQPKQAQKYFAETIRLDPKSGPAYIYLSNALIKQGKIEQAQQVFRKGIEAVPNDPTLHLELASLLRNQGLWQEADVEQQKAIALDPNIATRLGPVPPTRTP